MYVIPLSFFQGFLAGVIFSFAILLFFLWLGRRSARNFNLRS